MFCSFSKRGRNLHLKWFKSPGFWCFSWKNISRVVWCGYRSVEAVGKCGRHHGLKGILFSGIHFWCIKHLGNLMLKRFHIKCWTRIWKMMIISKIGISYSRKVRPFLCNMLLVPWCTWNFKQIGIWVGAHAWARPMAISNSKEGLGAGQPGWITADPSIYTYWI